MMHAEGRTAIDVGKRLADQKSVQDSNESQVGFCGTWLLQLPCELYYVLWLRSRVSVNPRPNPASNWRLVLL